MIPPGGGATVHTYKAVPESITWELTEIEQRGIKFLIGKAKVCEINAVSSVPSSRRTDIRRNWKTRCDRDLAKDEWQRRVDSKRIDQIAEFINIDGNVIANSALLFSPEGQDAIRTTENGKVIDFSKFLKIMTGFGLMSGGMMRSQKLVQIYDQCGLSMDSTEQEGWHRVRLEVKCRFQ